MKVEQLRDASPNTGDNGCLLEGRHRSGPAFRIEQMTWYLGLNRLAQFGNTLGALYMVPKICGQQMRSHICKPSGSLEGEAGGSLQIHHRAIDLKVVGACGCRPEVSRRAHDAECTTHPAGPIAHVGLMERLTGKADLRQHLIRAPFDDRIPGRASVIGSL